MLETTAEFNRSVLARSRVSLVGAGDVSYDGVAFRIRTVESRVSLYAQQIRAINLADAIRTQLGARIQHQRIAVIGGGVSGFTFAVRMLEEYPGVDVDIFERERQEDGEVLGPNVRGRDRWIWPRFLDWPKALFASEAANLPVLSWKASSAAAVRTEISGLIRKAIDKFGSRLRPYYGAHVTRRNFLPPTDENNTGMPAVQMIVSAASPQEDINRRYAVLVDATGLGDEANLPWHGRSGAGRSTSYWERATAAPEENVEGLIIVGGGDGGLIDLLCALLSHKDDDRANMDRSLEGRLRNSLALVAQNDSATTELNQIETGFQMGTLSAEDALKQMTRHVERYARPLAQLFIDEARAYSLDDVPTVVCSDDCLFERGASLVWRYCRAAAGLYAKHRFRIEGGGRVAALISQSEGKVTLYRGTMPHGSKAKTSITGRDVILRLGPRGMENSPFKPIPTGTAPSFDPLPRSGWNVDDEMHSEYDSVEDYLADLKRRIEGAKSISVALDRISPSGQLYRATEANRWFGDCARRGGSVRIIAYQKQPGNPSEEGFAARLQHSKRNVIGSLELTRAGVQTRASDVENTARYHLIEGTDGQVVLVMAFAKRDEKHHLRSRKWFRSMDASLVKMVSNEFESRWPEARKIGRPDDLVHPWEQSEWESLSRDKKIERLRQWVLDLDEPEVAERPEGKDARIDEIVSHLSKEYVK